MYYTHALNSGVVLLQDVLVRLNAPHTHHQKERVGSPGELAHWRDPASFGSGRCALYYIVLSFATLSSGVVCCSRVTTSSYGIVLSEYVVARFGTAYYYLSKFQSIVGHCE